MNVYIYSNSETSNWYCPVVSHREELHAATGHPPGTMLPCSVTATVNYALEMCPENSRSARLQGFDAPGWGKVE